MPSDTVITALIDRVDGLCEQINVLQRDIQAIRRSKRAAIPEDTLYNQQEVAIRLKTGESAIYWSKERKDAAPQFSPKKIKNLDDAGVLCPIIIGGRKKWREADVQQYLRLCREGVIDGYTVDRLKMK